jgi:transmembrane sensor
MKIEDGNIEARLIAYHLHELSSTSMQEVENWLNEDPDNQAHYQEVLSVWRLTNIAQPHARTIHTDDAWQKVKSRIVITDNQQPETKVFTLKRTIIGIAAIGILFLGISYFFAVNGSDFNQISIVAEHAGLESTLADRSTVILNEDASISYAKDFNQKERKVSLRGEAFFQVARDKDKPFIVAFEAGAVKVLGTSFNIKADQGDSIVEVFVKTGRVELSSAKMELILTKGDKAILNRSSGQITKLTEQNNRLSPTYWIDEEISFDHFTLEEVVDVLNEVYEEEILLDCPQAENKEVVTTLEKDELRNFLEVIVNIHQLKLSQHMTNGKLTYTLSCND